ncbi:MAG: ATP-dependent DNA helicase RecG [Endomicrobium sp.]|jgi:ATP-dependent DNA helicase RecG|nr:ATP-dependent DNA helicase RecG [Endomicrobium sp.]
MLTAQTQVQYINGIGPKRAQALARMGISAALDLLTLFPSQYQDRTTIIPISKAYMFPQACVFGKIGKSYERRLSMGLSILDIEIFDDTAMTYARFFRKKNPYSKADVFTLLRKAFESGKYAYIYADAKSEIGIKYLSVIDYEIVESKTDLPRMFNKIVPVYPLSEGLTQKIMRKTVKSALEYAASLYPDVSDVAPSFKNIPEMKSWQAILEMHYPKTLQDAENARRALALQEFFVLETALALSRNEIKKNVKKQKYEIRKSLLSAFKNNLDFEFTKAQKKSINEIFEDMLGQYPMNRMLMGDVGCGKTVVALSAALLAVENGYQVMIAAPTEILAEQHYLTISNMLRGINAEIVLATSSTLRNKQAREKILSDIKNGKIKIIIGTHSLMQNRVEFNNLSLIIVDEQHRFGVMQKFAALAKGETPDVLMMSATPIPRALAMTVYGEMDMSVINEVPKGRTPVKTFYAPESAAYEKTLAELKEGSQAYIVYPLIDESDKTALKSAVSEAEKLSATIFKNYKVGLLHGKMKPGEKNETMKKFKNKDYDVLISTTVIEVGIDVPNASVMIIQHAERFGLSALHQLRGRIGRGNKQSFCFLAGGAKSENAVQRLNIMIKTCNGFEIAEEDLKMRGPGELIGTHQHGFPEFKAGDIIKDADIIDFTKNFAAKLVETDKKLENPKHAVLKKLIKERFANKLKLINVG